MRWSSEQKLYVCGETNQITDAYTTLAGSPEHRTSTLNLFSAGSV